MCEKLRVSYQVTKKKLAQAFDFALDKIGMEIISYQIWTDHINFLKVMKAVGSMQKTRKE